MLDQLLKMFAGGSDSQLSPEFQRQLSQINGMESFVDPNTINSGGQIIPAANRLTGGGANPIGVSPTPSPAGMGSPSQPLPAPAARQAPPAPAMPSPSGSGIGLIGTLLSAAPGAVGNVGRVLIGLQQKEAQKAQTSRVYQMLVQNGVSPEQAMILAGDTKESTKFIREYQKDRRDGPKVSTVKDQYGNDVSARYDPALGKMVPITIGGPEPVADASTAAPSAASDANTAPQGVNPRTYANKRAEILAADSIKGPERERKRVDTMKGQYQKTTNMLDALDRADKMLDPNGRVLGIPGTSILPDASTGLGGAVASWVPGSEYYDMAAALDVLKSNLSFSELAEMRANSPTGGALGNVTVRELELLSSTMANFSQDQSAPSMRKNLEIIRPILTKLKGALEKDLSGVGGLKSSPAPAPAGGTQQPRQPGTPTPGEVVDGYRFKGGDPSNPASWEQAR